MILNPLKVDGQDVVGEISESDLPAMAAGQARLEYVPDISQIRSGDLILSEPVGKLDAGDKLVAGTIQHTQKGQFVGGTNWTHAAIYVDQWRMVEATPNGNVSNTTLISWLPGRQILIRRPTFFQSLTEHEAEIRGMRLALEAALHQGNAKYGLWSAIGVYFRTKGARRTKVKLNGSPEVSRNSLICSGLFAKCYTLVTQDSILSLDQQRTEEPISPAYLAISTKLQTIKVGWLKVTR